jgi:hypothetical protein
MTAWSFNFDAWESGVLLIGRIGPDELQRM